MRQAVLLVTAGLLLGQVWHQPVQVNVDPSARLQNTCKYVEHYHGTD